MARNFATSFTTPYRGAMGSTPVKFCGAKAVRLDFPWRQYGLDIGTLRATYVNPGVTFDVNRPPNQILDSIQGVFIDNTACSSPVYLRAEDTGHTLTCADGTSAFFPVLTGGTEFTLHIESVSGPYEASEFTRVILVDKPFPAYSDFQFAEFIPASQISGQNAFASQVQADQYAHTLVSFSTTTTAATQGSLFTIIPAITAYPNTLVLSSIQAKIMDFQSASKRYGVIRFYNNSSASGEELFKGGATARLYNLPLLTVRSDLVDITGVALRLDGTRPLTALPLLNAIIPSAETGGGTSNILIDVTVCYARIRTPTQ